MTWLWFGARHRALQLAALHDARALRARYGGDAEHWCEIGLMASTDPKKRRVLKSIRRALADCPPVEPLVPPGR